MTRCPLGHDSTDPEFCDVCGWQLAGAPPAQAQALVRQGDVQPGTRLGATATPDRYEIEHKLGQGGFGGAYLAKDRSELRRCVVKEMLLGAASGGFTDQQLHAMFTREASLLSHLYHPGLPSVWDAFEWDGHAYLVMSYVEGDNLETVALRQRIPEDEAIRIAEEVGSILSYLHGQDPPIIHRDISPDNIIRRSDGRIALLDFGAARFFQPRQGTDTVKLGKQGYAAPEAFRAQTDARADLYSLGAVLYRILLDHDPGETPFSFPRLQGTGVSPDLANVLERLVATNRDARCQSADELTAALHLLSRHAERCRACGRALDPAAWKCVCGRSLLPEVSWTTIGGESTHVGSATGVPGAPTLAWSIEAGGDVVGGAVGSAGVVAVAMRGGSVLAIEAATGRSIWARSLGGSSTTRSVPALFSSLVLVVIDDSLWAFELASGSASPLVGIDVEGDGELLATPGGNGAYVVGPNGDVLAVDVRARKIDWRIDLGFDIRQPPALLPDRLIVLGVHGTISCIEPRTGAVMWTVETRDRVTGASVVLGRSVVIASVDGHVRRYELGSGRLVGETALGDQVYTSMCVRGLSAVVAGRAHLSVVDLRDWATAQYALPNAMRAAAPVLLGTRVFGADLTTGAIWSSDAETGAFSEIARLDRRVKNWLACVDGWVIASADGGLLVGVGPQ